MLTMMIFVNEELDVNSVNSIINLSKLSSSLKKIKKHISAGRQCEYYF